jgi:hypothetical protein
MKSNGLEYVFAAVALGSNSNFDWFKLKLKIHKASSAARNVWFCKWFGYNYFYVSAGAVQNSRKWGECLVIR